MMSAEVLKISRKYPQIVSSKIRANTFLKKRMDFGSTQSTSIHLDEAILPVACLSAAPTLSCVSKGVLCNAGFKKKLLLYIFLSCLKCFEFNS